MILEIKDLKKNFDKKKVLKGIDLSVEVGDKIGIIGPSGCGKSTLLRCINLLEKPDGGSIIYNGKDITKLKNKQSVNKEIGMVFQQFNLFPHLTVLDNIILAPVKLKLMSKSDAIKKAEELLNKIGLLDKKNTYPSKLSGGQKQRVAICRTIIMNPKIILFDEPTSALDPEMIGEVTDLMKKIGELGITMIIVSHELNFIKNFCDKIVYMEEGKVVETGTPEEIFTNPKDDTLKNFIELVKKR